MGKIATCVVLFGLGITLNSCSVKGETAETKVPENLTGEWRQIETEEEDFWIGATIEGDAIEVSWISDKGSDKSTYWSGAYVEPTVGGEPYSWDSVNDHGITDDELHAANIDTQTFTYEQGRLSYITMLMGVESTVVLEKQN